MLLLTSAAMLLCDHLGRVAVAPSQRWVTVEGVPVLVHPDPEGKGIRGCPNSAAGKVCTSTIDGRAMPAAVERGYSTLLRIDGERVCLDTFVGLTDGMPAGAARYKVVQPGQSLVSEGA